MTYNRGPLTTFEITWTSGHVETIDAHQVVVPMPPHPFSLLEDDADAPRRILFHGEIDGRWQLLLAANDEDVRSVRNLTVAPDQIGGAS